MPARAGKAARPRQIPGPHRGATPSGAEGSAPAERRAQDGRVWSPSGRNPRLFFQIIEKQPGHIRSRVFREVEMLYQCQGHR